MEFTAEHIALFDAYLRKDMSAEERINFEERLDSDRTFKTEFEAFTAFEQDISGAEVVAFKDKLGRWDKEAPLATQKVAGRVIPLKLIGLAASVVLIIIVSLIYFSGSPNHESLLAANFEPYDNILTVRGEKEALDEGMMHYESKNYQSAIALFQQYPQNVNAQFYEGESHLALNEYDLAIISFKSVLTSNGIFTEIAEFHMALSYLGKGDIATTKTHLNLIFEGSDYYDDAQKLLSDLE